MAQIPISDAALTSEMTAETMPRIGSQDLEALRFRLGELNESKPICRIRCRLHGSRKGRLVTINPERGDRLSEACVRPSEIKRTEGGASSGASSNKARYGPRWCDAPRANACRGWSYIPGPVVSVPKRPLGTAP
jgi:hypothetical protein